MLSSLFWRSPEQAPGQDAERGGTHREAEHLLTPKGYVM